MRGKPYFPRDSSDEDFLVAVLKATTTYGATREEETPITEPITVFGPASLSNLGPGFDALGLCLANVGDYVDAWLTATPGVRVLQGKGAIAADTPADPAKNTAARAASLVLRQADAAQGIVLRIRKGIALGSGIGGSAASAVAGAWAANALLGTPFGKDDLVEAVLAGEAVASGCRHGDNVLPALFGGLVLVSPTDPARYRRLALPRALPLAVVLPGIEILTQQARSLLPAQVPLRDAVGNAADLAFLLDAFRAGDWAAVGRQVMQDRLVEPVRARLVPCYEAIRQAALSAGAHGCALTGSGPAMFAVAETPGEAAQALEAMQNACRHAGLDAGGFTTEAGLEGVRLV